MGSKCAKGNPRKETASFQGAPAHRSVWEHTEAVCAHRMQGQILGARYESRTRAFLPGSVSSTPAGRKELLPDKAAEVRRLTHGLLNTREALRASHLRLNRVKQASFKKHRASTWHRQLQLSL